jgi:hypothetical protein
VAAGSFRHALLDPICWSWARLKTQFKAKSSNRRKISVLQNYFVECKVRVDFPRTSEKVCQRRRVLRNREQPPAGSADALHILATLLSFAKTQTAYSISGTACSCCHSSGKVLADRIPYSGRGSVSRDTDFLRSAAIFTQCFRVDPGANAVRPATRRLAPSLQFRLRRLPSQGENL